MSLILRAVCRWPQYVPLTITLILQFWCLLFKVDLSLSFPEPSADVIQNAVRDRFIDIIGSNQNIYSTRSLALPHDMAEAVKGIELSFTLKNIQGSSWYL